MADKVMYVLVKIIVPTSDENQAFDILENMDYAFKNEGKDMNTEILAWGENPGDLA
jgi:hypothetical protein